MMTFSAVCFLHKNYVLLALLVQLALLIPKILGKNILIELLVQPFLFVHILSGVSLKIILFSFVDSGKQWSSV